MAWTDELKRLELWKIWAGVGGGMLLVVAGYWWFSYQPTMEEIARLEKKIDGLEKKLRAGQATKRQHEQFAKQIRRLEAKLDQTIAILPQESALDRLVKQVEALAIQSGLEIRSFDPGRQVLHGVYGVQPVRLSLQGTYNDLAVFVEKIAKEDRIVNLTNMVLTRARGRNFRINAILTAEVFWFIPRTG